MSILPIWPPVVKRSQASLPLLLIPFLERIEIEDKTDIPPVNSVS
jgi:hypothetical protein